MKKGILTIFFLGVIAIIAAISNPDANQHREALKKKIKTIWQKEKASVAPQDDWGEIVNSFGNAVGGLFIDGLIKESVSTSNLVLFSLTKIYWEGEEHVIGLGIFGNVFLTNEVDRFVEDGATKLKSNW